MSESSADEQHAESVVVAVAEVAGDAAVEFDEAVDGFGAAVVGAAGVVVGQERFALLLECLGESFDLRDRTRWQRVGEVGGDATALGWTLRFVGRPELLCA